MLPRILRSAGDASSPIPRCPAATPRPGVLPHPAPCPGLRSARAIAAGRPPRQNRARALRAAILALHECVRTLPPAPAGPFQVPAHLPHTCRAHTSCAAAATPAACQIPERPALFVPSFATLMSLLISLLDNAPLPWASRPRGSAGHRLRPKASGGPVPPRERIQ